MYIASKQEPSFTSEISFLSRNFFVVAHEENQRTQVWTRFADSMHHEISME